MLTAYFVLLCEIAHTDAEFNRPAAASAAPSHDYWKGRNRAEEDRTELIGPRASYKTQSATKLNQGWLARKSWHARRT